LSSKVAEKKLVCLEDLVMESPKTKDFVQILKNLAVDGKVLVCTDDNNENVVKSSRNIEGACPTFAGVLSVYDVLNHETLIMTKGAIKKLSEVLS